MNHVPRRILAPAASDQSKWAYQDVPDGTDTDEVHTPLDVSKLAPPSRRPGSKPVVLISCGSFNPPTLSHCRMFEVAFDLLQQRGYEVLGGFLSPVNDGYGKPGLMPAPHRVAMCRHAVAAAPRIAADAWEARQARYQRTLAVLQHFQRALDAAFPGAAARPMLLCGSDLLESFRQPGVWRPDHLRRIFTAHGCACLVRAGHDVASLLAAEGSILFPFREHVELLEDVVDVPISSSAIRAALMQRRSVKYLVPDSVIGYIDKHALYR